MKRLNNIIDFTTKTDEYIFYYNKIYDLTLQLDNCLRNRNFIINKFFNTVHLFLMHTKKIF